MSRGNALVQLAELGGVVRVALAERGFTFADVPPASMKKYAAANGNASKEMILAAAIRSLNYSGHSFDEADAMWLRELAYAKYQPSGVYTKKQLEAINGMEWPVLNGGA